MRLGDKGMRERRRGDVRRSFTLTALVRSFVQTYLSYNYDITLVDIHVTIKTNTKLCYLYKTRFCSVAR